MSDLKFAFRQLMNNPGFAAVVVISLAFGIGANTAVFSRVDRLLLRPLPVELPGELVTVGQQLERSVGRDFSHPTYREYRDGNSCFTGLIACADTSLSLTARAEAGRVQGMLVSGNFFSVLGVAPALGRTFAPDENLAPGMSAVAVLSHACWRRRFNGDPGVIGQTVAINTTPFTIIGVAPADFTGLITGIQPDLYVPLMMQPRLTAMQPGGINMLESRNVFWLELLGRLRPGVSRQQAEAQMRVLAGQIKTTNPEASALPIVLGDGSRGHTRETVEARRPLLLAQGAVGLLWLIACGNVASLLLARAVRRRREFAIRLSIGASRGRLFRLLLIESVLLSFLGGLAGLGVATGLNEVLDVFHPPGGAGSWEAPLDWRVLGFSLLLSVATGLVFGLAPAWRSAQVAPAFNLRDGAAGGARGTGSLRLRDMLVAGQAALSVVVLIGAALCVRSVSRLNAVKLGFDPARVLLGSFDLDAARRVPERGLQFHAELLARVRALPGVEGVSLARNSLLGPDRSGTSVIQIEGYQPPPKQALTLSYDVVGSDFFRTLGATLLRGREFDERDTEASAPVCVVNEALARKYWPGQDPLGKHIVLPDFRAFGRVRSVGVDSSRVRALSREVVGVVTDSKYRSLAEVPRPMAFWPLTQNYEGRVTLHVRSTLPTGALVAVLRGEVKALDPDVPLFNVCTLEAQRVDSLHLERMLAALLGAFGGIGLLLAMLGLYGVVAYTVNQRTQELGLRMALGAQRSDVLRLILRQGMAIAAAGLAVGLLIALGATRALQSHLFGVSATDPVTFASIAVILAGVALMACWLPARRATRVNPMEALRDE